MNFKINQTKPKPTSDTKIKDKTESSWKIYF